jgi:type IV secretory pathway VirB9-like protein
MIKKTTSILLTCLALAACASDHPRVIQASSDSPQVRLTGGMATQIEMPNAEHVQSVVTGDPTLVTAEAADNVVNLIPKQGNGETNLIVRAMDDDGHSMVYQYRIIVQAH